MVRQMYTGWPKFAARADHGVLIRCSVHAQVFMTFLLVMTVYAAAVVKPGHGNTAPLAIGLSLYAAALTGETLLGKDGVVHVHTVLMHMACQTAPLDAPVITCSAALAWSNSVSVSNTFAATTQDPKLLC